MSLRCCDAITFFLFFFFFCCWYVRDIKFGRLYFPFHSFSFPLFLSFLPLVHISLSLLFFLFSSFHFFLQFIFTFHSYFLSYFLLFIFPLGSFSVHVFFLSNFLFTVLNSGLFFSSLPIFKRYTSYSFSFVMFKRNVGSYIFSPHSFSVHSFFLSFLFSTEHNFLLSVSFLSLLC